MLGPEAVTCTRVGLVDLSRDCRPKIPQEICQACKFSGWDGEAEAVHTARQLAFAYDLLGILDLETSWGSFTEQNSCSRWWYQSN